MSMSGEERRERQRAYKRDWYKRNKDYVREYNKEYWKLREERTGQTKADYLREWQEANQDRVKASKRKYNEKKKAERRARREAERKASDSNEQN